MATADAEMNAIQKLNELSFQRPSDLTLYTTVEPCPMCMGSIVWSGIGHVNYGVSIKETSRFVKQIMINSEEVADKSWMDIKIKGGIKHKQCLALWENTH